MHHAAQAALLAKGAKEPKTHRGLIGKFGEVWVKNGPLEKTYPKNLSKIFDARQRGTYEVLADFGVEGVEEMIDQAEEFTEKIKELVAP